MLRNIRLILLGAAGVYFWQWISGVPEIWAPELNLAMTWTALIIVTLAMIFTEKADA